MDLPASEHLTTIASWGGATRARSWLCRPGNVDEIRAVLDRARRDGLSVGFRGAGKSYGDAPLNDGGIALDLTRMDRILAFDAAAGIVDVEPGVTIQQLWRHTLPHRWWPAFCPGTSLATLGGAAAMNVHGKNHWKVGPMGEHVLEFDLLLPDGSLRTCTPADELFAAAIGSFGMLGCFTRLRLALRRIPAPWVYVEPFAVRDVAEMIAVFEPRLAHADYLIGWIDAFTGRGLVHQGTHPRDDDVDHAAAAMPTDAQELPSRALGIVPVSAMWRLGRPLVNDPGIRLVNAARWRVGCWERPHREDLVPFTFLLDRIPDWQRAFGRHGLVQYQSFVPAERAAGVFGEQLRRARAAGVTPYTGIFKRHRADRFLMSYAVDGYSLGMDFRVTAANRARLWALAAELDRLVIAAGGRFYFAKDSTLSATSWAPFLGEERVQRFLALKRALDPDALLQTDLWRRIFGAAA